MQVTRWWLQVVSCTVVADQDVLQGWPSIEARVPRRAVLRRVFSEGAALRRERGVEPFQFEPKIMGGEEGGWQDHY